tara:strand:+ start:1626 stop:1856 length:231 start_codon:yes stop_codon:yes gene_type:complete
MKFKDLLKLEPLFENAKNKDKCKKKHCKDLMKAVEAERKENGKYIQNYFAKSKAHKEFIKNKMNIKKLRILKNKID